MSRITIIDGHPHEDQGHYVHALADAYAAAAQANHEVRVIKIAALDFPILRDPGDWHSGECPPGLRKAQEDIAWAEHLVMIYPLWLGDVPALFKAFLEQVARPGFALEHKRDGFFRKLLGGKSARIIVTMGMPAAGYRLYYREHSVKSLKRNVLHFVGIAPVKITLIGDVESASQRDKGLKKVTKLGSDGD